jgi:hypothetical protein
MWVRREGMIIGVSSHRNKHGLRGGVAWYEKVMAGKTLLLLVS